MQAREEFHKAGWDPSPRGLRRGLAAVALGAFLGCSGGDETPGGPEAELLAESAPSGATDPSRTPPTGRAWIIFGADTVVAEVAASADERAEGLMYREAVPDGTGMLFVFPDVSVRSFWMANTYVPLDIAFMDPAFSVVDIVPMQPLVTESYTSRAPAQYGLEVRQGWLAENGIAVGARAQVVFGAR